MFVFERIIAHRGASAYAPENTFAAFNKAVEMGVSLIEFDVMLSADGCPFIFHDIVLTFLIFIASSPSIKLNSLIALYPYVSHFP